MHQPELVVTVAVIMNGNNMAIPWKILFDQARAATATLTAKWPCSASDKSNLHIPNATDHVYPLQLSAQLVKQFLAPPDYSSIVVGRWNGCHCGKFPFVHIISYACMYAPSFRSVYVLWKGQWTVVEILFTMRLDTCPYGTRTLLNPFEIKTWNFAFCIYVTVCWKIYLLSFSLYCQCCTLFIWAFTKIHTKWSTYVALSSTPLVVVIVACLRIWTLSLAHTQASILDSNPTVGHTWEMYNNNFRFVFLRFIITSFAVIDGYNLLHRHKIWLRRSEWVLWYT